MAVLLNDVWHNAVIDFGCVSCGLSSSSEELKVVCLWSTGPMKELVKKGRGSRTTLTGLWIE